MSKPIQDVQQVVTTKTAEEYAKEYVWNNGSGWFAQFSGPEDESLAELVRERIGYDFNSDDEDKVPGELVYEVMKEIFDLVNSEPRLDVLDDHERDGW